MARRVRHLRNSTVSSQHVKLLNRLPAGNWDRLHKMADENLFRLILVAESVLWITRLRLREQLLFLAARNIFNDLLKSLLEMPPLLRMQIRKVFEK